MTNCAKPARFEKVFLENYFSWACPILSEFFSKKDGIGWGTAPNMIWKAKIRLVHFLKK